MSTLGDFSAKRIDGETVSLKDYEGRVVLVVNTASKCGFTPQFTGLEAVFQRFHDKGFVVLGFPCNQFLNQDPGSDSDIAQFCSLDYGVTFPMFAKIDVNGPDAHPLFQHLTQAAPGLLGSKKVKWNFTKFLVGKDGKVIDRYAPTTKPEDLVADIEKALAS
ncbi:glutathione peroxidase [Paraperlucidibaca wandonensis]|jgi:glutathione peroxidase|uniref:Glutathione peroxidase n=1 Tax=Paraperlucidibaca wandonensis TaxID=1268273 RepID=A0ABW3HHI5_9GAMM|nr:glutathione peroxidase [Paraperlucidibaca sp.]MBQ0722688.1 glutathione peroxidase [Paraperlucidibaca sp.]MBQ0843134.1 glutathione peroxidase [Paraperlucidibaca sp.]|tara:strand:+ start:2366 stop:2851 length:486 start_codon:yes stop_codon:yes gene_type:complete